MGEWRRVLSMVVVVLVVGLTACTGSGSTDTTGAANNDQTTSSTSTTGTDQGSTTTSTAPPGTGSSGGSAGTFDDPMSPGEVAQVGDWSVRVIAVTADATDAVLAENSFNDAPEAGHQFFLATLEAEYVGTDSGTFWIDMNTKALGPSAVAYEGFDASCGVIPDSIDDAGETFPGGIVSGNVCWSVTAEDAADLVMLLEESFSFNDTRIVYVLDPTMEAIEANVSTSSGLSGAPSTAIGESTRVGDWLVRVVEVTPDATDAVLAENSFNDAPEAGHQFFIAALEAEYVGTESGVFWVDMNTKAVGVSGVAYEGFDASCGVIPDSIDDAGETFPGGVIMGNVCWSVTAEDAAALVMLLEESFSFDDVRAVFSLSG